jgi:hypothetical protein
MTGMKMLSAAIIVSVAIAMPAFAQDAIVPGDGLAWQPVTNYRSNYHGPYDQDFGGAHDQSAAPSDAHPTFAKLHNLRKDAYRSNAFQTGAAGITELYEGRWSRARNHISATIVLASWISPRSSSSKASVVESSSTRISSPSAARPPPFSFCPASQISAQ